MRKDYSEILKDPRWQRKRLEVLQAKEFTCEDCGDTENTLHVHHRYYIGHRLPWNYPDFCYQVLCKDCHESINHDQGCEVAPFMPWEVGLNHFGERVYEMSYDELVDRDLDQANGPEK